MKDKVQCKLCNRYFKAITNTHLKKEHNISILMYRSKFPKFEVTSEKTKSKRSKSFSCHKKDCQCSFCKAMRGEYKGKIFTEEHRKNLSLVALGKVPWNKGIKRPKHSKLMSGKACHFYGKPQRPHWGEYKNINMRSSWEIAYAKYLDKNNIKWEYEPDTFDLEYTTYTPDFKIENKKYIEIKGYMSPEAYFKIKKFILTNSEIDYVLLIEKDLKQKGILK